MAKRKRPAKNPEDWFWSLVEGHVVQLDNGDIDPQPLLEALKELPAERILEFERLFFARYAESYTEALWGAAYTILGGCSDDSFDYFRGWLIGKGRKVYERALKNPDSLARVIDTTGCPADEQMCWIGQAAYEQSTGKPLPELPYEYPKIRRTIDFEDDDAMKRAYPKLVKKFDPDELFRMERPWRGEELLERCRVISGSRKKKWDYLEDTHKFLHRFRPSGLDSNGLGLKELLGDYTLGEETARRVIAVMKIDGDTKGKLKANRTRRISKEAARQLFMKGCKKILQLAEDQPCEEREATLFEIDRVVMPPRGKTPPRHNKLTKEAISQHEMVGRGAIYNEALVTPSIFELDGAIYGLIEDELIAHHIMWPRCEGAYKVSEPFEPFFELWRAGATWRLPEPGVAELFLP